jgi:histidine triad (HIT) family protein
MASIFTRIINGEIPSYKIAEDVHHYAFLDINPLAKGHTLAVPKIEVDYIYDLSDDQLSALHLFAKRVALALEATLDCKRVGVLVIGTEVPHAHIHLIPFQQERQMAITNGKITVSSEEMSRIAENARKKYEEMWHPKSTLVFGASINPERYSNQAMKMLKEYNHSIVAIGGRENEFEGTKILTGHPELKGIDTVTMYMGEDLQRDHEEYILSLHPRRIIFNPGAENISLFKKAQEQGIEVVEACTLVMLRTGQYSD